MLTRRETRRLCLVRGGVVDDCHCIACVAVVEPDRADAGVRLECGVITGSTSASTPRRAVAVVGHPALRSAGRARSGDVGRRAVRRVERVSAALRASPSSRHSNRVCTHRRFHPGGSTPGAGTPAREDGTEVTVPSASHRHKAIEVARVCRPRRRRYERGYVAPGPVRRIKRREPQRIGARCVDAVSSGRPRTAHCSPETNRAQIDRSSVVRRCVQERIFVISRSAMATVVRCVFAFGRSGMTDASQTRRC